jgi:hypothetical protein
VTTSDDGPWYWCLRHSRVEPKAGCPDRDRLGPYETADAARHWRERVAARNAEADAWDD